MEVIRIAGYTEPEKLNIATKYLVPKEMEANGLKKEQTDFAEAAILRIIREYTREAGVRNLEREIASICRKIARKIVTHGYKKPVRVSARSVERYLGVPKFRYGEREEKDRIGLTNGLAWTEVGGELLAIEVSVIPGAGKVILTGKLGDVMQESAQAALTYVRSRADSLGISPNFHKEMDIHVHVPEGAIPKDGPSAGIAIATSIASALTKRRIRSDVAMTGEITLRGRVLPIGGVKEKLLAAHRALIKTVIVSRENRKDLAEVPKNILKDLEVICVENMDDVLKVALREGTESSRMEEPASAPVCQIAESNPRAGARMN
jgi:ATP-dependent Lon protease